MTHCTIHVIFFFFFSFLLQIQTVYVFILHFVDSYFFLFLLICTLDHVAVQNEWIHRFFFGEFEISVYNKTTNRRNTKKEVIVYDPRKRW